MINPSFLSKPEYSPIPLPPDLTKLETLILREVDRALNGLTAISIALLQLQYPNDDTAQRKLHHLISESQEHIEELSRSPAIQQIQYGPPDRKKRIIAVRTVLTTAVAILGSIIAAIVQERLGILNNVARSLIIVAIFLFALWYSYKYDSL